MNKPIGNPSSDVAFTAAVKSVQVRKGSRIGFVEQESKGGWATAITPSLAEFIGQVRTCFLGTATAQGQPYVQHRGGPAGFLQVLDAQTIGFADFTGNLQYITTGNLEENPRAILFLIDYTRRKRAKLWGTAKVVENDAALNRKLSLDSYPAEVEQAIVFTVEAWDMNCPRHIPIMLPYDDVATAVNKLEVRIGELEAENAALKQALAGLQQ